MLGETTCNRYDSNGVSCLYAVLIRRDYDIFQEPLRIAGIVKKLNMDLKEESKLLRKL